MTAAAADDQVVLSVTDTGIGIEAGMLPRVFDLFVQERQTLARSRGGLGLGLAIVRSLVELHGGTVTASSAGPGSWRSPATDRRRIAADRARPDSSRTSSSRGDQPAP